LLRCRVVFPEGKVALPATDSSLCAGKQLKARRKPEQARSMPHE
jgi:hypothetical protein